MIGHQKILGDMEGLRNRGMLGHGYIFHGPAMVGKRTAAALFANYLEHGTFEEDSMLSDMMLIKPGENGSIGIDAVREVRNFLWQKPNASPRRTLIIDDAELLTTEAQNALLKITEEPPVSSLLIFITSDIEGILPTITSRLPRIYFGTVKEKEIEAWLGKEAETSDIAKKAMGKPGLAWRFLHDKDFQEQIALAEKLLKTPPPMRRDVIKKILEPEDFHFRKFLDAVLLQLAWRSQTRTMMPFWHKALALYDHETNFSLNPRLQLEALLL